MSEPKIVILISANSEWRAIKEILNPTDIQSTPLGETFTIQFNRGTHDTGSRDRAASPWDTGTHDLWHVILFHGGWGKISAAATTQYVIDTYRPDLLVNLGTCGGFEGQIERGTIILVNKTIVYDIFEQMFDSGEAVKFYSTEIDLSWMKDDGRWTMNHGRSSVVRGLLVSADRDIFPGDIPMLVEKYGAVAADWESGAIAWVAKKNGVRCLILRGVTDLVGSSGGEAYGNNEIFRENTKKVMNELIEQLPEWLTAVRHEATAGHALFHKVDCIRMRVADLESGLAFYRDRLRHDLIWRSEKEAGLRMPGTETEIVIQTENKGQEVEILVGSADEAARCFVEAGGTLVMAPFDIQIGRCCVVRDPWGNQLVLLDASKGLLKTDEEGNVTGNIQP